MLLCKEDLSPKGDQGGKPCSVIFTVGHSTRTLDEFGELLKSYGVLRVVDIRTIPRSRHNPQFERESLSKFLRNRRINYRHVKALGGLRHARVDSANKGWRNSSFRGFADYMQSSDFEEALQELIELAFQMPTAIMCAEAVPWRCHRSLIGDALTIRSIRVVEIFSRSNAKLHTLTSMAKVQGTRITYPA